MIKTVAMIGVLLSALLAASAQQTVFNVPSGDVLGRGKVYGEFDYSYLHVANLSGYTPRVVIGFGGRVEGGVNVNGMNSALMQTNLTPTIKWKAYDGKNNGWAFLLGDDVFIPVQNRSYDAGNYVYAEFTKTLKSGTRFTFGAYHFSRDVVASAQRAGGQFAFEQPLNKRVTFATDWFTGDHALGYVSPGAAIKLTSKLTFYGAYQIGNRRVSEGNHQLLVELGWNLN